MYATDFEFNGKLASEHGLMVCTWGDESDVAEGGNIEPNVIKPPNRDTFDWYGGQFNEPLVWNVSIANSMCSFTVVKEEDIIGSSTVSYLKDELQYYQDVSVDTEDLPEDLTQFKFYVWNADLTFDAFYQISKADLDDFILDIKDKGQLMMMPILGTPTSSSHIYKFNFTTLSDMDAEISIEKERAIAKWLMKPGYKWTRFLNDRDGSESLWYKCNVSVTPHQLFGTTIGFDLIFTSNCAYGFTDEQVRTHTINSSGSWRINVNTDINEYVYPIVTINGMGEIELYNENDLEQNLINAKQTKVKIRSDIESEIDEVVTGAIGDTNIVALDRTVKSEAIDVRELSMLRVDCDNFDNYRLFLYYSSSDAINISDKVNNGIVDISDYDEVQFMYVGDPDGITISYTLSPDTAWIESPYIFDIDIEQLEDKKIQIYQNITPTVYPERFDAVGIMVTAFDDVGAGTVYYVGDDEYHTLTFGDSIVRVVGQVWYQHSTLEQEYTEQFDCKVQLYNAGSVVLDADNDIITGIVDPKTDFNYYFLHLVNGRNIIKTTSTSDVNIEIKYREARRVIL